MPPIARIGSFLLAVALAVASEAVVYAQVMIPEPNDGPLTRAWLDASRRGTAPEEIASPRTPAAKAPPAGERTPPVPPFDPPADSAREPLALRTKVDAAVTPATNLEPAGTLDRTPADSDHEPRLLKSSEAIPLRRPGESEPSSEGDPASSRGGGISTWLTVGSSLAVVLSLFFVFAWVVRRGGGRALNALPKEAVEVLGRTPLAPRQHIHLIRCGNKVILVAVSPEHVEPLAEITEPAEVDRLTGLCRRALPGSASVAFQKAFRDLERSSA